MPPIVGSSSLLCLGSIPSWLCSSTNSQQRCSLGSFLSNVRCGRTIAPFSERHCLSPQPQLGGAFLLHMEEKKPYGLRRTRAAARDVYICERFVKGFTRVNGLGFATLQSSNDASLEHIHKDISVMSMGRSDLSRREKDYFNQTFSPTHIGKIFRIRGVSLHRQGLTYRRGHPRKKI